MSTPSEVPITRQALARMSDRISFLYAERCVVNRDGNSLTITDQRGVAYVPATQLAALLLGPGTKITYAAMALLGDAGVTTLWVGERGVRYYAHGRPPAKSSRMAEIHAQVICNQRKRLDCARRMYALRFPGEDVSGLTMSQLRGREGARMKRIYAAEAGARVCIGIVDLMTPMISIPRTPSTRHSRQEALLCMALHMP